VYQATRRAPPLRPMPSDQRERLSFPPALDRRGRAPHEAVSRSQRLRSRLTRPPSSPSGAHQRPAAGSLTGARVVPTSEEGVPGTYGTRATSGSRHSREMSVLGKEGCVRVWPECGRPTAGHPALAASPRGRCRRIKAISSGGMVALGENLVPVRVAASWGCCRVMAGVVLRCGHAGVGQWGRAARDAGAPWDANPDKSLALGS
jgi:hypothetical protein